MRGGGIKYTLSFAMVQWHLFGVYMYMHIKWNASISFLCVLINVVVFVLQLITLIK